MCKNIECKFDKQIREKKLTTEGYCPECGEKLQKTGLRESMNLSVKKKEYQKSLADSKNKKEKEAYDEIPKEVKQYYRSGTIETKSKEEAEQVLSDYKARGYKVKSYSEFTVTVQKSGGYGNIISHIAIFTLTFWTFGLINIFYAKYKHDNSGPIVRIKRIII